MADEAENTQPEDQTPQDGAQDTGAPAEGADSSGAEDAVDQAAAIAGDVAAQAEEGADVSDDEAAALAAAMSAIGQVSDSANQAGQMGDGEGTPFESPEFGEGLSEGQRSDLELLSDVHMNVRIELGRTRMYVEDVLRLGDGAVVELDKLAGDPVDVFVNDRKVARGEVLVLNDNFCVRISEILDLREA